MASIDISTLEYTVNWDDGDLNNRVHRYDEVALNLPPNENLIGIGSHVYFQQGVYLIDPSDATTTAKRWHKGTIVDIYTVEVEGVEETRYAGHHVERPAKLFKGYSYSFNDFTVRELRISPDPMTVLAHLLGFDVNNE